MFNLVKFLFTRRKIRKQHTFVDHVVTSAWNVIKPQPHKSSMDWLVERED